MNATEFCYWLQGLFELGNPQSLDARQTELVRRHLAMAFQHDIDLRPSAEQQAKLNALHAPTDSASSAPSHPPGMRC